MDRTENIFLVFCCWDFRKSAFFAVLSCLVLAMEVRESNCGMRGATGCSRGLCPPPRIPRTASWAIERISRCPQDVLALQSKLTWTWGLALCFSEPPDPVAIQKSIWADQLVSVVARLESGSSFCTGTSLVTILFAQEECLINPFETSGLELGHNIFRILAKFSL